MAVVLTQLQEALISALKNNNKEFVREGFKNKQAQICAEGCEEDNITHFF